jgi:hypothetical protein
VGTVGNKSPLFGIRKVMLRKQVDLDIFEEIDKGEGKMEGGGGRGGREGGREREREREKERFISHKDLYVH